MPLDEFLRSLADMAYVVLLSATLAEAVRRPRRPTIDAALFFATIAGVLTVSLTLRATDQVAPPLLNSILVTFVMALPYLLLRLADDFAGVRPEVLRGALAALVVITITAFLVPQPYPAWYTLLLVADFAALTAYATSRFIAESRRTRGIIRYRMRAVAGGSGFLTVAIIFAGLGIALSGTAELWAGASALATLACGLSFFIGFVPPERLRRYWQEGDLRAFFEVTTTLPATLPLEESLPRLNRAVAAAVGAREAFTILWEEGAETPHAPGFPEARDPDFQPQSSVAAEVFRAQQPRFIEDATRVDPDNAEVYRRFGATSLLLAPVTADGRRWGVLSAFSDRPWSFFEDDLRLLASFAGAIAAFLARSELVHADVERRAEEEALRLKDEFLSAAAHDLRTPLTVVLGQAQLLERRLRAGRPDPDLDLEAASAILMESRRMQRLANSLLDVARIDSGRFVLDLAPVDVTALVREVASTVRAGSHRVVVEGEPVIAEIDRERLAQVIANLLDNAIKFSPEADRVDVRIWSQEQRDSGDHGQSNGAPAYEAHIRVRDSGVGIPYAELPAIFERFRRGVEAQGRFTGSGVGLYVARRIVEEHGGRIWAESERGRYTELHVTISQHAAVEADPSPMPEPTTVATAD